MESRVTERIGVVIHHGRHSFNLYYTHTHHQQHHALYCTVVFKCLHLKKDVRVQVWYLYSYMICTVVQIVPIKNGSFLLFLYHAVRV
jgi:hypothetical protein